MNAGFFRRPLGVVVAITLSFWFLTSTPATPFDEPPPQAPPTVAQQPPNHTGNQVPAAITSSNGTQTSPQPPTVFPDSALPKGSEQEQARFDETQRGLRLDSGQAQIGRAHV